MSTTSDERLHSVRLKIERANEHIDELKRRIESFRSMNPYGVRHDFDANTNETVFRIDIRNEVPVKLSVVIGEVIHQLRSSLDHLAWQLVKANTGVDPGNHVYFPICETLAKYKAESPRKIQGMSSGAISIIDALQPYGGGNDDFWKLHKLNNIDKHCFLVIASICNMTTEFGMIRIDSDGQHRFPPIRVSNTLQDNAELGRIPGLIPPMKNNIDLRFEIAFSKPPIVEGELVLPFLSKILSRLNSVVDLFESLL